MGRLPIRKASLEAFSKDYTYPLDKGFTDTYELPEGLEFRHSVNDTVHVVKIDDRDSIIWLTGNHHKVENPKAKEWIQAGIIGTRGFWFYTPEDALDHLLAIYRLGAYTLEEER